MADKNIVLYHYVYSPYARRIVWYLTFRGIPYSQCLQPPIMPRPDVSRLGINYRRIPILAIGRDVYLDTRLQLNKLEELDIGGPRLGANEPDQLAVQHLLSTLMQDAGVFRHASSLLPPDLPLLKNPAFQKDREEFFGSRPTPDSYARTAPNALREMASVFKFLETTLLADNRDWILKTKEPSLADIEAVWPLHWMVGIPGALPKDKFSPEVYPKVYAWIQRFDRVFNAASKKLGKPKTLSGEDAASLISGSAYHDSEKGVDAGDFDVVAMGLAKGDNVSVAPTDTGARRKDNGRLVSIDTEEVVIETGGVRVHAPRHGFRIRKADGGKL